MSRNKCAFAIQSDLLLAIRWQILTLTAIVNHNYCYNISCNNSIRDSGE